MKKILVLIALSMVVASSFGEMFGYNATPTGGNSPEVLAKFKPHVHTAPKQFSSYIDTRTYYQRATTDLYFGAQGAANYAIFKRDLSYQQIEEATRPSGHAFVGGGFIGVGKKFYNAYLGLEGYGYFGEPKYDETLTNNKLELRLQNMYGLDLVPGWFVSDNARLYLRGGIVNSKFRVNSAVAAFRVDSFAEDIWGLKLGVGVDLYLTPYISLRPEYNYILYRSITHNTTVGAVINRNKFSPNVNSFSLGVAIHFFDNLYYGDDNN